MGLEGIEILVEVENCFGIEIEDSESVKLFTVGNLVDCVWGKVNDVDSEVCLTQILFFKLRTFFCKQLNIEFNLFKPDSFISEFLAKEKLDDFSLKLESFLKLNIPSINYGNKTFLFFENSPNTIHHLVDGIIRINIKTLDLNYGLNKKAVSSIIISVIHLVTGIPSKTINSSSRFGNDLGI